MSGFSADWLALREPYDHAARARTLLAQLAAWAAGRPRAVRALDLGSGTGSTLRALAVHAPALRDWTLAEHDPGLIARGGEALRAAPSTGALRPRWVEVDLAGGVPERLLADVDLITASALVDLVSGTWLDRLLAAVRTRRLAVYVALSYDGRLTWTPSDPADAVVKALFDRHQHSDKGFGPALGPDAAAALERRLASLPGRTLAAPSDWRLAAPDRLIQAAMVDGLAAAARAIDPASTALIDAWARRRQRLIGDGGSALLVGHRDVLHLPAAARHA